MEKLKINKSLAKKIIQITSAGQIDALFEDGNGNIIKEPLFCWSLVEWEESGKICQGVYGMIQPATSNGGLLEIVSDTPRFIGYEARPAT